MPDNGHVCGAASAARGQGVVKTERQQVVRRHDRGKVGRGVQQVGGRNRAGLTRESRCGDSRRRLQRRVGHGGVEAVQPSDPGGHGLRTAEMPDARVAERP